MRMRPKSVILYLVFPFLIVAAMGALVAVAPTSLQPVGVVIALVLFALLGVAQFVVLACPKCGASAILTPSGLFTILVGTRCRHCHSDY
jgi:hypothetical protein